jgi:hypothetical protein
MVSTLKGVGEIKSVDISIRKRPDKWKSKGKSKNAK